MQPTQPPRPHSPLYLEPTPQGLDPPILHWPPLWWIFPPLPRPAQETALFPLAQCHPETVEPFNLAIVADKNWLLDHHRDHHLLWFGLEGRRDICYNL